MCCCDDLPRGIGAPKNNLVVEEFIIVYFTKIQNKTPAYGRQRMCRPMQIVASIFLFPLASKKGLIAIFFSFFSFFGGGMGETASRNDVRWQTALLPWENRMGRGQQQHTTDGHRNSMKESA